MTFKTLITTTLLGLICLSGFLALSLEYREFFAEPDIFVQQRTNTEDKIVKISNKKTETIFTAPKIQDFAVTKTQMLVATGEANQKSELALIDLKTQKSKKLDYLGKTVSKLASSDNNFALITSQKDTQKSLVLIENEIITEFNPESLLTNDCCLLLNPSGSFLVFKGLAEKQYLVDLSDPDKAIISKPKEEKQFARQFANDKDLIYNLRIDGESDDLEVFDVITGESKILALNTKYPTDIATDLSKAFYLGFDLDNNLVFNDQEKSHSDPNFTYIEMAMHPKSKFILLQKNQQKRCRNSKL
jgi:hypothetical protein